MNIPIEFLNRSAGQLFFSCLLVFLSHLAVADNEDELSLISPDGTIRIVVEVNKVVSYSVAVDGKQVLKPSKLSLQIDKKLDLQHSPKVLEVKRRNVDQILQPEVRVKSATIRDHFNEMTLVFDNQYSVVFRAYDNGVAYRYVTTLPGEVTVNSELVELVFSQDSHVYYPEEEDFYSHNERAYIYQPLADIGKKKLASTPALVSTAGIKLLITESSLQDYAGLWLLGNGKDRLVGTLPTFPLQKQTLQGEGPGPDRNEPITKRANYLAKTSGNRKYPWRILAIARQDGDLINNQLSYQLAVPNRIGDTSWIKPGKVAWDWYNANNLYGVDFKAGVNTETYMYYIDFAADYGIEYVILDEGWYPLGDLLGSLPNMDVPALIAHAKSKGVEIILWTSWMTLRDQFDAAMDRFAELGAVGIKPDFFQRDDQEMVNFYWKIAEEAAKRKLLVDFHGSYKPAGLRRTYPNVISREGVRGLEWNKWSLLSTPEHNVTLPFIRMVAGPMDYTPGAMSNAHGPATFKPVDPNAGDAQDFAQRFERPMSQTTRVHQMAMLTVFESPLQMLADSPSNYRREHECTEFMAAVPSVWDETRVLHGSIGDYIALARRKGAHWFIGAMTDENARELDIDLSFLGAGNYEMVAFQDGINADRWAEDYKKVTLDVTAKTQIKASLTAAGGWTARLTPK
ncbi:glycoside hydrolase family 97 protein [Pseudomaricurvus alcaniphilus]|uniref:glycoside hydrolase family 97 protein n=1 Tax=Pseudomaricurvus alcaniphilus TaxID=1166482 RepID=UPI0014074D20|nr:glycoside hydrolase family 97 protein [Pseudomaricurvus alcaniphilus]NHN39150.1 glycoside hydrolase family 97 protein [Pseudomaricurvus alcaniphilus]